MIPKEKNMNECRIETKEEIEAYLAKLRYALEHGAELTIQMERKVDNDREIQYTNRYTIADLFPNENPYDAIKRELKSLTTEEYIRTVKDIRFPNRSEMREFGKKYNGSDDVYIKIRVELLSSSGLGTHTAFVMSFHYAMHPLEAGMFPYRKQEEIA